jgi:hypothetical protein
MLIANESFGMPIRGKERFRSSVLAPEPISSAALDAGLDSEEEARCRSASLRQPPDVDGLEPTSL